MQILDIIILLPRDLKASMVFKTLPPIIFAVIQYSVVYMGHIFFIHSSVVKHRGCFRFLVNVNRAATNTFEQLSLW